MEKIIYIIILFSFLSQNGIGQTSPRLKKFIKYYKTSSDPEFIKSIEDTYTYSFDGKISSRINKVFSGSSQEILTWEGEFYEYDEHKLLKKKSIKRYNPDVDLWITKSWKEYKYDSYGCLIEESNIQNVGGYDSDKTYYERNIDCQVLSRLHEQIGISQGDTVFYQNYYDWNYLPDGISFEKRYFQGVGSPDLNFLYNKEIKIFNSEQELSEFEAIFYTNFPTTSQYSASKRFYEYDEKGNVKKINIHARTVDTTEWHLAEIKYLHNEYDENGFLNKRREEHFDNPTINTSVNEALTKIFEFKNSCTGLVEEKSMLREQSGYRFREEYIYEGINECFDLGEEELNIQIYPNPSDGFFEISSPMFLTGNTEILIFSIDGKVLLQKTEVSRSTSSSINLSFLPNGFYILQLRNGKHFVKSKIVIAK